MKRVALALFFLIPLQKLTGQVLWDGGGDGISWSDANNWVGNSVPASTDLVLLDNSNLAGNYSVNLPNTLVTITSITITPDAGNNITLTLPASNTLQPGLAFNGPGYVLVLNNGGVFKNSTGSPSSTPASISFNSTDSILINNGGRFIHNSVRAHAYLIDQLSRAAGTELGIFEFDVPTAPGYTVSLTNRVYGTLMFTSTAAGGNKTYGGSGASDLSIRGNLIINSGATFNSTMTANINLAGHLDIIGAFTNIPSSGTTGRSLIFNGTANQNISGSGTLTFGGNFLDLVINTGATVTLFRAIDMGTARSYVVNGTLQMGAFVLNGSMFNLNAGGWLGIGSSDGINASPMATGNVQTGTRNFSGSATYEYNGAVAVTQSSGSGLPSTILRLKINTDAGMGTSGVTLTQPVTVTSELDLTKGKVTTNNVQRLTLASGAIAVNYTLADNSFVNGPLFKNGNTSFVFPVGKGVTIHPLGIVTSGGNVGDVAAGEYFTPGPVCAPQTPTGGIHHTSGLEYWQLGLGNMGGGAISQITLYATTLSNATDRTRLVVARCVSGTGWINLGNNDLTTVGATGIVTSSTSINGGFPGTTIFTLASLDPSPVNPLPINLVSFVAGKVNASKSALTWELAACCSPLAKFEIQRAGANRSFSTITSMAGSETNRFYNSEDPGLQPGINYYRLKMIDTDGSISYSRTVAIMNGVEGILLTSLVPSIVTGNTTLTIASSSSAKLSLQVVDMQGRLARQYNHSVAEGNTNIILNLQNLPAGIYQLIGITSAGKTNVIRFVR